MGEESQVFTVSLDRQLFKETWNDLVKMRAGYVCEQCGYTPPDDLGTRPAHVRRNLGLHAHHIDSNHANNCISNGACLCHSCHASVTAKARHAAGTFGRSSWKPKEALVDTEGMR